jgi:hypothetical protein
MAMYGNRGLLFSSPIHKPVVTLVAKMNTKNTETLPATSSVPSERVQQIMMSAHESRELDNDMGLDKLLPASRVIMAFASADGASHKRDRMTCTDESLLNSSENLLRQAATSDLARNVISDDSCLNFLQLILLGSEEFQDFNIEEALQSTLTSALTFRAEIVSAKLRSWMNLEPGEPCYHDITLTSVNEPSTMHKSYVITQIDVTAVELANRAIKQANAELAEERERINALLQRQYELIDILRTETSKEGNGDDYFTEKINFLRSTIAKDAVGFGDTARAEEIRLDKILGRGNVSVLISDVVFLSKATDLSLLFSSVWDGLSRRVAWHHRRCEENDSSCRLEQL